MVTMSGVIVAAAQALAAPLECVKLVVTLIVAHFAGNATVERIRTVNFSLSLPFISRSQLNPYEVIKTRLFALGFLSRLLPPVSSA